LFYYNNTKIIVFFLPGTEKRIRRLIVDTTVPDEDNYSRRNPKRLLRIFWKREANGTKTIKSVFFSGAALERRQESFAGGIVDRLSVSALFVLY